jgi:hypothetical protein
MAAPRRQCLGRFYQGSLMAGFQVTTNGRFWVTAEGNLRSRPRAYPCPTIVIRFDLLNQASREEEK